MSSPYSTFKHFNTTFPFSYVAHIEINRPEKLNAFYQAMWQEYASLLNKLSVDPSCRVIVLSGAGRAFSAGLDLQFAQEGFGTASDSPVEPARKARALIRTIEEFQGCISAAEKCEKPIIAVFHGISYGLAIDIACCTDIRIAAADTRFSVREVDIGLAADIGTLSRLPKIVGSLSWVKDVCFSARDFSAGEALQQGFVSRVCESKQAALEAALELGKTLAAKSPVAVQSTKELVNYSLDRTVAEGLRYTQVWNASALQSSDPVRAVEGTMRRKVPTFEKL